MNRLAIGVASLVLACWASAAAPEDAPAKQPPREALKAFHDLIGAWKGTGQPEGTREEKQKGFWVEAIRWEWQFKGDDAWLTVAFDKGRYFDKGELRYLPDKELFQLTVGTPVKETLIFQGTLKDRLLTLDRVDEAKRETQRLAISMLHNNRFLYRYEVKPQGKTLFTRLYQVGATKEGVPFASTASQPECIVSGGLGTMPVTHNGKTYYVCCSGCRAAFRDEPEKYIKEYEAKKAKEQGK